MTEELLTQAKIAQKNIRDIEGVLNSIERINLKVKRDRLRSYQPCLNFLNMSKKKNGKEIQEATVLLFNGVNTYGTEVPVDERLLDCLKEHYRKRLSEAKAVLEAM